MIRQMKIEDWYDVAKIYSQSIKKGNATFMTKCPSYLEWDELHIKECRYVYEIDEKIVGYVVIAPTSSIPAYYGAVEVSIYIDDSNLHRGIGTSLMNKIIDESEKCGYWTLYSAIFSSNKASIGLHKKCGFHIVGTRENIAKDIFGIWQSTTIMERRSKIII